MRKACLAEASGTVSTESRKRRAISKGGSCQLARNLGRVPRNSEMARGLFPQTPDFKRRGLGEGGVGPGGRPMRKAWAAEGSEKVSPERGGGTPAFQFNTSSGDESIFP